MSRHKGHIMKYLILVPDGAADEKIKELGGRTPLEAADMPVASRLAARGRVGLVRTIPEGIAPGSDAANLAVMGYDPAVYLTGRSPLEAASIGIDLAPTDVAFRANLVTLSGDGPYEELVIQDHSAGDISTAEADQLIQAVNEAFADDRRRFYTGVSYRHCLVIHEGGEDYRFTPPHDQLGKQAGPFLPQGADSAEITDMMKRSYDILRNHPVNLERVRQGKNPANSLWIWGQGKKPALDSFQSKYGIHGAAISAVDLIKGIAICAGLESIDVEGATGTLHTNFEGKAKAAIEGFARGLDFIYLHLEGPDECSHQGDLAGKVDCLSAIDKKVLAPVLSYLESTGEAFCILVLPDHRTPVSLRTHTAEPVPYVLYRSEDPQPEDPSRRFTEASGAGGLAFDSGHALADYFFREGIK